MIWTEHLFLGVLFRDLQGVPMWFVIDNKIRYIVLILSGLLVLCFSQAIADELSERADLFNKTRVLFSERNFEELSRISDHYRDSGERMSSGLWKLDYFYKGFSAPDRMFNISQDYWSMMENRALSWAKKQPGSPTPHIAYAIILQDQAWRVRGTRYANTVTQEQRIKFHKLIAKARAYLLRHREVGSKDPHWYANMLDIAKVEAWPKKDFEALFSEAIQAGPYYYGSYFSGGGYYHPSWHGTVQELEDFARKAIEYTEDQEGKGIYARIYWSANHGSLWMVAFTKSRVSWSLMKEGIDDVLSRYPDQWNIQNFAHFSCQAMDKEKTKELINRIDDAIIESAWTQVFSYEKCKGWAFRNT